VAQLFAALLANGGTFRKRMVEYPHMNTKKAGRPINRELALEAHRLKQKHPTLTSHAIAALMSQKLKRKVDRKSVYRWLKLYDFETVANCG
jgi:hypothetical protein